MREAGRPDSDAPISGHHRSLLADVSIRGPENPVAQRRPLGEMADHPPLDIETTTTPTKTVSAPAASRQVTCSSFWITTLAIRMETSGEV